ncbi:acetoin utilization protein AcuC [Trebonia sp.]|uniref:acetoin utilization protein AcuC n=1 Tax=Trebonia sp. TaxID=2767075 RepID=UPI002636DA2F|nr:acetoin utilization protein AcuC [Trebonia sp.]
MAGSLTLAWDDALLGYDFGPGHPLAPVRVALTVALAGGLGVLAEPSVTLVSPPPATDSELATVHDDDYIAAVRRAGRTLEAAERFGLGTEDNPVFEGMHEASALVAGATLAAARAVWSGSALHAASISGGLHHAMRRAASGFCVYNDPAIAIKWLLAAGAERVAYVDTDVHHGDGVQAAFYSDPRVLTISLHESPATLFPGTGLPTETGEGAGDGYAVNVALPAGTGDAGWLRAFDAVVPPLLRAFKPAVLVSQHGCDSHRLDPLAHLELSVDGQRAAAVALHDLAHELCDGRWLFTGGGGYALVQVVPRTWTHLLAIGAGAPVDPVIETPVEWRELARSLTGETAPLTMTDGAPARYVPFSSGLDPSDPVDRAIMRTRGAVFASHGLLAHP